MYTKSPLLIVTTFGNQMVSGTIHANHNKSTKSLDYIMVDAISLWPCKTMISTVEKNPYEN